MRALISTGDLAERLDRPDPPLLLDVRWALSGSDRPGYEAAHLPDAVFCDLDVELAAPPGDGGRHPLPDVEDLGATLARLGVGAGREVVAYDDGVGAAAARAWWLLRWAGHEHVRVLDGGLAAWVAEGRPVEAGDVAPVPAPDAVVRPGGMPTVTADDVLAGRVARLVDARAPERFRGAREPVDPVAGRIPGAASCPTAALVGDDGRYLPADRLRELLLDTAPADGGRPGGGAGGREGGGREGDGPEGDSPEAAGPEGDGPEVAGPPVPVAAYCGSGVTAAQLVLAGWEAGVDVAIYPGSWSEWIRDAARPVATA